MATLHRCHKLYLNSVTISHTVLVIILRYVSLNIKRKYFLKLKIIIIIALHHYSPTMCNNYKQFERDLKSSLWKK